MLKIREKNRTRIFNIDVDMDYTVVEADVVNVLLQELAIEEDFFKFFMKYFGIGDAKITYVGRSIVETERKINTYGNIKGENDLVVLFKVPQYEKECAVFIEVKVDAIEQELQPERYINRCAKYEAENMFAKCYNVIVAPKEYYNQKQFNAYKYNYHIFLQEIIDEYYGKICKESSLRKQFNVQILERAIEKVKTGSAEVNAIALGWRSFTQFLLHNEVNLYNLISTSNYNYRKESTCEFFFDEEKDRKRWIIGCHFTTGKYFLAFEKVNKRICEDLEKYIKESLNEEELDVLNFYTTDRYTRLSVTINSEKFGLNEIYSLKESIKKPEDMDYDEVVDAKVKINYTQLEKVEKVVNVINKLVDIAGKLDKDKLKAIYED